MSDESQTSPVVANAQQALAIKGVNERIDGLKGQIRALWITVAVVGVIALVGIVFTFVPSLRAGLMGSQFRNRTGTFNGQQFNGGGTGTGTGTQQTPQTTP